MPVISVVGGKGGKKRSPSSKPKSKRSPSTKKKSTKKSSKKRSSSIVGRGESFSNNEHYGSAPSDNFTSGRGELITGGQNHYGRCDNSSTTGGRRRRSLSTGGGRGRSRGRRY